jgi:hypothetical protein
MREGTEPSEAAPPSEEPPPPEAVPPPDEPPPPEAGPPPDEPALEPLEPTGPPAATPTDRGSLRRSIALGVVAFVATLVLLVGASTLIRRSGERAGVGASVPPSLGAGSGSNGSSVAPSAGSSGPAAPSDPPGDPVLVGAGDIADCAAGGDEQTASLLDTIGGTVFTAGDNAYPNGTAAQFTDCYGPTWGRHLARTKPAAGNHDWETKDLAGYYGYFGTVAHPAGTSWYSYDLGSWHVIVLDADCEQVGGCAADSKQGKWLADDLAGSKAKCTMAIWHQPRFSSGKEHGDDTAVSPFWEALYDAGADVVVNGHDHDYERFAPQDPDARADDARGLREFVVGTGGAELRDFTAPRPNSLVRAAHSYGVLRFVLHQSGYEWRFISTDGQFSDSGAAACH